MDGYIPPERCKNSDSVFVNAKTGATPYNSKKKENTQHRPVADASYRLYTVVSGLLPAS
jgi:hypothetical protein